MAGSTVSSRPLVPSVRDDIKVPTGEAGDLTINVGQIKAHILGDIPAPDLGDVVQYVNQNKTPDEKAIVRSNIGAADILALQQLEESTNSSIQEINTTLETVEGSVEVLRTEYESTVSLLEQADSALQSDIDKRVRYDVDTQNLTTVQQTNARTNIDAAKTDHTHTIADVNDLQNQLDAKATGQHSHTIADTTGLQNALDDKESTSNKAVNLSTPDDVKYPTTKAVSDGLATKQNTITLGSVAQYLRGDLSLSNFASDVLSAALSGLVFTTNAAITATDTVLQAFGKLQAQIDKRLRFDAAQTLTAAEQTQLRTNLGTAAGLQYFDEVGSIGSHTLKPKLISGESASSRIDLRLVGQNSNPNKYGVSFSPTGVIGIGSFDFQNDPTGAFSTSGTNCTTLGNGWVNSGTGNLAYATVVSNQGNTLSGTNNIYLNHTTSSISGSSNVVLGTALVSPLTTNFNLLLGANSAAPSGFTGSNVHVMSHRSGGLWIPTLRDMSEVSMYFTEHGQSFKQHRSLVVSNPVAGTWYRFASGFNTLNGATTHFSGSVFVEGLTSNGAVRRSFTVSGSATGGFVTYTVTQAGNNTTNESLLASDLDTRVVVVGNSLFFEVSSSHTATTSTGSTRQLVARYQMLFRDSQSLPNAI